MSEQYRFNLVQSGYDCYQVNSEIDRLEFHIQELNEKILMYQNNIEAVNNQFAMIKKRYQLLVSELSSREKQADDVARLALKEANTIIEEAQKNADKIIQNAMVEIQDYIDQVNQYNQRTIASNNEIKAAMNNLVNSINTYESIEVPNLFNNQNNEIR